MLVELVLHLKIKVERRKWWSVKEERNHRQYSGMYTLYFWIHDNFLFKQRKTMSKRDCQTPARRRKKSLIHEKVHGLTFTYSQVLPGRRRIYFRCLMLSKLWTISPSACKCYRLLKKKYPAFIKPSSSQIIIVNYRGCFNALMALVKKTEGNRDCRPQIHQERVLSDTMIFSYQLTCSVRI